MGKGNNRDSQRTFGLRGLKVQMALIRSLLRRRVKKLLLK
jgi:hypothetical protein